MAEPPRSSRQEQAEDSKEHILLAAVTVLELRGFSATRVADIAVEAGVSTGLVLYHFGSREQLLAAALRVSEDIFIAHTHDVIASVTDPKARLRLLMDLSFEDSDNVALPSSWLLWLDMWQQALRNEAIRHDAQELDRQWRDIVAATVRQGQQEGVFALVDADRFARMLGAMEDGFAIAILLEDSTFDKATALELRLELLNSQLTPKGQEPLFTA